MATPHRHPTARAESGTVTIPVDCDVCGATMSVQVPKMEPAQSVWIARGHTAATVTVGCGQCNRRMQVEFALRARVVSIPPMPVASWRRRVGYA